MGGGGGGSRAGAQARAVSPLRLCVLTRRTALRQARDASTMDEDAEPEPLSSAIVLAEDKKYYPSADEVRGSARLQRSACRRREDMRWLRAHAAARARRCTARARRRW